MKKKILIVVANYYKDISAKLLKKCTDALSSNYKFKIYNAPGAFEIPVIISKHIKKFDGAIALGCVIKGKTPHFDFISQSVNIGLMNLSIYHRKPIGNGVLTCLNKKQALERINKGKESAEAVTSIL